MRELEIGEQVVIEDYRCVVVWQGSGLARGRKPVGRHRRAGAPGRLETQRTGRVCFSEQRWLTKARGRVLEREDRTLKLLLVGQDERVQRRGHVRVPVESRDPGHRHVTGVAGRA